MTADLAVVPQDRMLASQVIPAGPLVSSPLAEWAGNARLASEVARQLVRTPFVPASLLVMDRGVPDVERSIGNVLGALLAGDELGLQPMAALRSIDIIQGTPAMRAMAMRAVVQSHGHDLWLVESTDTRCIMRGRRKGSEHEQESIWTIDRAKKLNLVGKPNWRNQPAAMLIARATSECARLVASDVLLGLGYSIEELQDGDEQTGTPADEAPPAAAAPARTARRRTAQPASVARPPVAPADVPEAPEPNLEPSTDEAPAADAGEQPEAVREAQLKKMHAQFGDLGISDRDERLALVSSVIGRDVTSSNDLTKDEASSLIEALDRQIFDKAATGEQSDDATSDEDVAQGELDDATDPWAGAPEGGNFPEPDTDPS